VDEKSVVIPMQNAAQNLCGIFWWIRGNSPHKGSARSTSEGMIATGDHRVSDSLRGAPPSPAVLARTAFDRSNLFC